MLGEMHFPHSLGLLYSAFTQAAGFRPGGDEYKVMGLAPYGEPRYADLIRQKIVDLRDDGSLWVNREFFHLAAGRLVPNRRFETCFGPARQADAPITRREMDLAASIQAVTEDGVLAAARHVLDETGMKRLCMAGGVALNCVANGRLLREGLVEDVWIQPAAGDAGGALGAALHVWHAVLDGPREGGRAADRQGGSLLGPAWSQEAVEASLDAAGAVYETFDSDDALLDVAAADLAAGRIVGHVAGRAEFGPRALGNRSILADPRDPQMHARLNGSIKFRENFRPFAPAVLGEHVHEWFDLPEGFDSPYMLLVAGVARAHRDESQPSPDDATIDQRLDAVRSDIPAVTHVDGSARVQTVDPQRHERFHRLITKFHERTGVPVVVNTSFNVRGEPIVNSPIDAYCCFMDTGIDVLVIERCRLVKGEQPRRKRRRRSTLARRRPTRPGRWFSAAIAALLWVLVLLPVGLVGRLLGRDAAGDTLGEGGWQGVQSGRDLD
jgi:carbamoyltransferase